MIVSKPELCVLIEITQLAGVQPSEYRGTARPLLLYGSVGNRMFSFSQSAREWAWENHKGLPFICQNRGRNSTFSTHIATFFGTPGKVPGTGKLLHPEALLAIMDTVPTEGVVLPPSGIPQEESPLHPPFLAPAHRSPCSGVLRPGCPFSEGFRSAHSRFASSSRSRMEGFAFPCSSPRRPLLITPSIIL